MPKPLYTLEETIKREESERGHSRHDTDCPWSGGYNVDDCALFQSWAIWDAKVAWNVDVLETVSGGTYHRGKSGLRRGDVVLFSWNNNSVADHTEMCVTAPNSSGLFKTIGANGGTNIAVNYHERSAFVLGYFRPAYVKAKTSTTAVKSKPIIEQGDKKMPYMIYNTQSKNDDTRRAVIYEFSFQVVTAKRATRLYKEVGKPNNVTSAEWEDEAQLVQERIETYEHNKALIAQAK